MPYFAVEVTETAPPAAPLFPADVAPVDGVVVVAVGVVVVFGARLDGTVVVPVPIKTFTWPARSDASALAVVPKYPAIFAAFAEAPAP